MFGREFTKVSLRLARVPDAGQGGVDYP